MRPRCPSTKISRALLYADLMTSDITDIMEITNIMTSLTSKLDVHVHSSCVWNLVCGGTTTTRALTSRRVSVTHVSCDISDIRNISDISDISDVTDISDCSNVSTNSSELRRQHSHSARVDAVHSRAEA